MGRDVDSVRAHGGAEHELLGATGEGAHGGVGLRRRKADHVDDDIEALARQACFELARYVPITDDHGDVGGRAGAPTTIEQRYARVAREQLLDDARADQARAADDQDLHRSSWVMRLATGPD
jgi:hypothetical protein